MSSKKRKIASALALGATVTGAISSGATSAGLFDLFKNKEDLNNEIIDKQKKGYDAAIQVAKNIYEIMKDDKENKSVLEIIKKLIQAKENSFLESLGVLILKKNVNKEKTNVKELDEEKLSSLGEEMLKKLESYFFEKIKKLQGFYSFSIAFKLGNLDKNSKLENNGEVTYKTYILDDKKKENDPDRGFILYGKLEHRIKILKTCFDKIMKLNEEEGKTPYLIETLIKLAKDDTLGQTKEPKMPLLNLSYEDLIKNLIENTMKDSYVTYRDDFYKVFEEKDKKESNVAAILHELGYNENMNWLPSYDKEKGGLSIGIAARSFVPTAIVWTLGYLYPPITVVGGIAGLFCNAVVKQSASSLWNNLRHKETRTSFLNPNNWEVSKFLSGVVSSFAMYGVCKYIGI